VKRGPLTDEQKAQRKAAREANAKKRADLRAQRRAEALRSGVGVLRWSDTSTACSVHPTTLWRWVKDGSFPAPTHFAGGVVGWPAAVVAEWLAKHVKGAAA